MPSSTGWGLWDTYQAEGVQRSLCSNLRPQPRKKHGLTPTAQGWEASASGRDPIEPYFQAPGPLSSWSPQRLVGGGRKAQAAGLRPQGGHGPHRPGPRGQEPHPEAATAWGSALGKSRPARFSPPVHGSGSRLSAGCADRWGPVPLSVRENSRDVKQHACPGPVRFGCRVGGRREGPGWRESGVEGGAGVWGPGRLT